MSSSLTLSVPRKGVYAQVAYGEFDQSKWGLKGVPKREKIVLKQSVTQSGKGPDHLLYATSGERPYAVIATYGLFCGLA